MTTGIDFLPPVSDDGWSMERIDTEWIVITGAPSSGKSTIANALKDRGHLVMPEPAEICINTRLQAGELLHDICALEGQPRLQREILALALEQHAEIDPGETCFFDRTAVDCIAYCSMYGLDPEPFIEASMRYHYKRIFMLDRVPFQSNHVRIENDTIAAQLDTHTENAYRTVGYDITRLPATSVQERLDIILSHVLEGEHQAA